MPQYSDKQLNSRSAASNGGQRVATAITASRTNTAIQFSSNTNAEAGLKQWAGALVNFGQGFEALGQTLYQQGQQEIQQKDVINAKLNAKQAHDMGVPFNEAINAMSPDSSETYKDTMRQSLGIHYAQTDANRWSEIKDDPDAANAYASENGVAAYDPQNADPSYHTKYAQDYFERSMGAVHDPLSKLAYTEQVSSVIQKTTEQATATSIDNAAQLRNGAALGQVAAAFDTKDQDPNYYQNNLLPYAAKMNIPRGKMDEYHATFVASKALNPENPQPILLDMLKKDGEVDPKTGKAFPSWATRNPDKFNQLKAQGISLLKKAQDDSYDVNEQNRRIAEKQWEVHVEKAILTDPKIIQDERERRRNAALDNTHGSPAEIAATDARLEAIAIKHAEIRADWKVALQGNNLRAFQASNDKDNFSRLFSNAVDTMMSSGDPNATRDDAEMRLALQNKIVAPRHVGQIKGAIAAATLGDYSAFEAISPIIAYYGKLDSPVLLKALGDDGKLVNHYLENLSHTGGDTKQAVQLSRLQTENEANQTPAKFSEESWNGSSTNPSGTKFAVSAILAQLPGSSVAAVQSPEVQRWFGIEKEKYIALGTSPDTQMMAQKFQESHTLINKQFVDTSALNRSFTEDEAEVLSTAVTTAAKIQIQELGLDALVGVDLTAAPGDPNYGDINLVGVPRAFSNSGKPLYMVQVNGHILPKPIELDSLSKQYANKDSFDPEAQKRTLDMMGSIKKLDAAQGHLDTPTATLHKQHIKLAVERGEIGDKEAKDFLKQVEKANTRFTEFNTTQKVVGDRSFITSHPMLNNLTDKPAPEYMANITLPNQRDSLLDTDLQKSVYTLAKSGDVGDMSKALSMAIFGNKVTGATGDHIGIGYNINQNPKLVKEDFSATGLSRSFGKGAPLGEKDTMGVLSGKPTPSHEKILDDIIGGKKRLDANASDALFERQVKRSNSLVDKVLSPQVYHKMSDNLKAVYTTLGISTGDESSLIAATEAIANKDWEALGKSLKNVPEDRRAAAVGLIQLMGRNTQEFTTFFEREAVVDPQKMKKK